MFPRAYVNYRDLDKLRERSTHPDVLSLYGALNIEQLINTKIKLYVNIDGGEFCEHALGGFTEFVELMYNYVLGLAMDLVEGRVLLDIVIENPRKRSLILVPQGTKVTIVEARGKAVHALVEEGDVIDEGTKLFYVTTRKFEVRVVRAPVKGVVVHIGEVLQSIPQTLAMVIADGSSIKWLRRSDKC